ncbi:YggT family protein [Candidatus Endowatersipora endosymbiont of Watersipora subatra]|uniref:YggT family protein n=1 Tax=Candidatus Endowatersipora endosymbiont of Watersipora subatra TaxID=3077946 RepID=UPI00312C6DFA
MIAIFSILHYILDLYWWIVVGSVIITWLYVFNVLNPNNQSVRLIKRFLHDATEPLLIPLRRLIPHLGTIDISPIILLLGILFVQLFLRTTIAPALGIHHY